LLRFCVKHRANILGESVLSLTEPILSAAIRTTGGWGDASYFECTKPQGLRQHRAKPDAPVMQLPLP
ncbi:MAG: hypothetical protein ACK6EB_44240, partial [Planctomyces sp.]